MKFTVKALISSLILLLCGFAQASVKASAVRVDSFACADRAQALRSTGLLLRYANRDFVLTTSAGILDGQAPQVCQSVTGENGERVAAELKGWRWNDLAVLEITVRLPISFQPAELGDLEESAPVRGEKLTVEGYDPQSGNPVEIRAFETVVAASDRGASPRLMEIQGSTIESTFSGGPLLNAEGKVAGLVASHYVQIDPGHPSLIRFWQPGDRAAHFFGHAARDLKQKFLSLITGYSAPIFTRDWHDQLASKKRLQVGHLTLEEDCPPRGASDQTAAPYPIGGVDPIGIGGPGGGYGCRVWVRQANSTLKEPAFVWYQQLSQALASAPQAEIVYALKPNPTIDVIDRQLIGSLEELTNSFLNQDRTALVLAHGGDSSIPANLQSRAQELQQRIKTQFTKNKLAGSVRLMTLLRELYFQTTALQSEQWQLIEPAMLTVLLEDEAYRDSWRILIEPWVGGDPKLKEDLAALNQILVQTRHP